MEKESYYVCSGDYKVETFYSLKEAEGSYNKAKGAACLATKSKVISSKPKDKADDNRLMRIGYLIETKVLEPKSNSKSFVVLWHDIFQRVKQFEEYESALQFYKDIGEKCAKVFFNKGKVELGHGGTYKYHCMGYFAELDESEIKDKGYYVCSSNYQINSFSKLAEAEAFYKKAEGSACLTTESEIIFSKPGGSDARLMKIGYLVNEKILRPKYRLKKFAVLWHDNGQQIKEFEDSESALKFYNEISSKCAKVFFKDQVVELSYGGEYKYHCMGAYAELEEQKEMP